MGSSDKEELEKVQEFACATLLRLLDLPQLSEIDCAHVLVVWNSRFLQKALSLQLFFMDPLLQARPSLFQHPLCVVRTCSTSNFDTVFNLWADKKTWGPTAILHNNSFGRLGKGTSK